MLWTGRRRPNRAVAAGGVLILTVTAGATTSCAVIAGQAADRPLLDVTRQPATRTSVLTGSPSVVAGRMASALFVKAPLVVLASAGQRSVIAVAAARARRAHAPLLLVPASAGSTGGLADAGNPKGGTATQAGAAAMARSTGGASGRNGDAAAPAASVMLRNEVRGLDAKEVLDVGVSTSLLSAQLPGVRIITDPAQLPAIRRPAPLRHVVVLVRQPRHERGNPGGHRHRPRGWRAAGRRVRL